MDIEIHYTSNLTQAYRLQWRPLTNMTAIGNSFFLLVNF
jgi:hypothetical protein